MADTQSPIDVHPRTNTIEKPKKRPRPANLDLKESTHNENNNSKNMSQYAIQCLSPGLPPLDPQMQSTILISKTIEQQQRQLIAARQTPTGLTAPLESLSIPSSTKRLKRNAPPPLNLQQQQFISRPAIMSAPIHHYHQFQQYYTPKTGSKVGFKRRTTGGAIGAGGPATAGVRLSSASQFTPMTPYGIRKPIYNPQRSGVPVPYPRSAIPPRTAGGPRYRGFRMKREEGVVDVFTQGERMAPLAAQPLSAQREFFDRGEINLRPQTAIPKDIKSNTKLDPKEENYKKEVAVDEKINEESESDVENNAIEPEATVGLVRNSPIDGELRILNNVFKFQFERASATEGGDEQQQNTEQRDKTRFLNHCEKAWEEFVRLGN